MSKVSSVLDGTVRFLLAAVLIGPAQAAFALDLTSQKFIEGGDETFTLNLGGVLTRFNTSVRLDGQGTRGTTIDVENNGGQETQSSFAASATLRFWSRNRIDLQYFQTKRSGNRQLDQTVVIGDDVIPVGTDLSAEAENEIFLADYRFSFVKTKEIEVAGLVGFYGGRYNFNLTASTPGSAQVVSKSASTTVPLPLIGGTLDWHINPRWKVSGRLAGLKANIGDIDGSIFVAGAAAEFMLVRNFGIGVAYMYTDLDADVSKSDFNGNLSWKMNSVYAYAQFKF